MKQALKMDANIPSDFPLQEEIGKLPLMVPTSHTLEHPASNLLASYAAQGCPINCRKDWSLQQILLLLKQGPHISGKQADVIAFLQQETAEKVT